LILGSADRTTSAAFRALLEIDNVPCGDHNYAYLRQNALGYDADATEPAGHPVSMHDGRSTG